MMAGTQGDAAKKLTTLTTGMDATGAAAIAYSSKTIVELKTLCRARSIPVTGSKAELVKRLEDQDAGIAPTSRGKRKSTDGATTSSSSYATASSSTSSAPSASTSPPSSSESGNKKPRKMLDEKVLELVKSSGYTDHASKCTLAAIARHFVTFNGTAEELDKQAIFKGEPMVLKCCECSKPVKPTLRELLQQGEDGRDYEEGSEGASIECPACEGRMYVPFLCAGNPDADCGRAFNHCTVCEGFGQCIGDYRNAHCDECGKHYYQGLTGFDCPCTDRKSKQKEGLKQIMGILGYGGAVGDKFIDQFGDELLEEEDECGECEGCFWGNGCEMLEDEEEEEEESEANISPRTLMMRAQLQNLVMQEALKKAGRTRGGRGGQEECAVM